MHIRLLLLQPPSPSLYTLPHLAMPSNPLSSSATFADHVRISFLFYLCLTYLYSSSRFLSPGSRPTISLIPNQFPSTTSQTTISDLAPHLTPLTLTRFRLFLPLNLPLPLQVPKSRPHPTVVSLFRLSPLQVQSYLTLLPKHLSAEPHLPPLCSKVRVVLHPRLQTLKPSRIQTKNLESLLPLLPAHTVVA